MNLTAIKPRIALNKAYLKIKPNRSDIERFKANLIQLLDRTNDTESEEFHKNLVIDFLKKTYYEPNHFINTKGKNDLVIHNGSDAKSAVGVIIEAKKPTNKAEMISSKKLNVKAFQELVLYFLRERITHKNLEVKHLVATNINEWFIFESALFEKLFAQNKAFVKQFEDFEAKRLSGIKTDFFYKDVAEPFIASITNDIEYTYFDIREYEKPLRNNEAKDDNQLIALFKLLSPEHLLKLPFANDSNSLDKRFYGELLHIIGLVETKEGGKKVIQRKAIGEQNTGSLLENAIIQLDSLDKIGQLKQPKQFGDTYDERLFNVGLELVITWINRILFLKLLEAQLISYHKGDKSFSFLNIDKLHDYDDLNSLFFQVLAKKHEQRNQDVKQAFEKVPYLNSSLFEPTTIEHETIFISNLRDDKTLPVFASTVLKDESGKKKSGEINALTYLYEFLNAYDFSSEGSEEIQEDNKTLINASVLGLIFEKINGYKDGSFFTPGFITMYMCRETIRRAVVQKFNETKQWELENFDDLYDKIEDRSEANQIVNSIKICDPAVGSGHFLVSALNEMIAVKNDLKILQDRTGKRLKEYQLEVVNDELIVADEDGELFEYNPKSKESQRVQETLFHEKQTIIENCLFGVDINPNSVKICRLRLWIELLKSAYYKNETELETLPNIDINIKCGNSLIARFALDADLKQALKKSNRTISDYKNVVKSYQNATSKEEKRNMEELILQIKQSFSTEIRLTDPLRTKLQKLSTELYHRFTGSFLFEPETPYGKTEKELEKKRNSEKEKLESEINKIEKHFDEVKNNKIYENAFEWRFEFPEVLNDEGDFVGFDVVIGNPPYVQLQSMKEMSKQFEKLNFKTYNSMGDLYNLFYEKGSEITKENGLVTFITGSAWMRAKYGTELRKFLVNNVNVTDLIDFSDSDIFENATVLTNVLTFEKNTKSTPTKAIRITKKDQNKLIDLSSTFKNECVFVASFSEDVWIISDGNLNNIKLKVASQSQKLKDWDLRINRGVLTGLNKAFIISESKYKELINDDPKSIELLMPLIRGRDVKKYTYDFQNVYLITTFPSKKIEIDSYPAIRDYLLSFGDSINQSGNIGSRKKTNGKWFETQDSINYWQDFDKPKIVYSELTKFIYFSIDFDKVYVDKTTFILTAEKLEYLVCFLNSKLFKYCYSDNFSEIQGNTRVLSKVIFEQIPVKQITDDEQQPFIDFVNKILSLKKENPDADTTALETQIDQLVYELYGLTEEEIKIVEGI